MPPAKKAAALKPQPLEIIPKDFLTEGQLCNLVVNGQTLPSYEYLGTDGIFLKFRANVQFSPQTELVLIPFHAVERVGLVGVR